MARGRKADPQRAKRGTGHRPAAGERVVEIVKQEHSMTLQSSIAQELPAGLPRDVFLRSCLELGDKLRDTDLEALRIMAWSLYRHSQAQEEVEKSGLFVEGPFGNMVANPALKMARDEASLYLKIADQYALTFTSRLRAGILQLAGQSMLSQMHESMAAAIVARIVATDPVEQAIVADAIDVYPCECGRSFTSSRGLAVHKARVHR